MILIKFGGTSVSSLANMQHVRDILKAKSEPFIVVVSALSGTTNKLQYIAEQALAGNYEPELQALKTLHHDWVKTLLQAPQHPAAMLHIQQVYMELEAICEAVFKLQELSDFSLARIMSKGEILSSKMIQLYLQQEGLALDYLHSPDFIVAKGKTLSAKLDKTLSAQPCSTIDTSKCYIAPGFIAKDEQGHLLLLGRGGSDYSAAIYASLLNASALEIWSDVDGMLNANPNLVSKASLVPQMSYAEAFEMAYFGAKVLYPPTIEPLLGQKIPIYLKNTLKPQEQGTLISDSPSDDQADIVGVSSLAQVSLLTISGLALTGTPGSARRVFRAVEAANVNVLMIAQSCSEQNICIGIQSADVKATIQALEEAFAHEILLGSINPFEVSDDNVVIAVVGDNMKSRVGLSGKVLSVLGENNINVKAIVQGASERNISIVVRKRDERKAVNVVHERLFRSVSKKVHLFVIGNGNVGSQFLSMLEQQTAYCREQFQVELCLVGVANSTRYLFDEQGLDYAQLPFLKQQGNAYQQAEQLVTLLEQANLRNSIVVDNTASELVSQLYKALFNLSISVVTCNKIALSAGQAEYQALHVAAKRKNCHFKYETAVGAALPIIKTIQDLRMSGDQIHKIEAVLSGSLNFIFNEYKAEAPFVDIVKQAQLAGYTEPDPRIDLTGLDVRRKILILAREAGYQLELADAQFEGFIPETCIQQPSVDEFLASLAQHEDTFKQLYLNAQAQNCKLKVIAGMDQGKLQVALRAVSPDSPFYKLDGKDNIVAICTKRYAAQPLIVKGAGAGAELTASGIFADLMYLVNHH
jgi:aspartokinase/homoserine dehydrogenase 1